MYETSGAGSSANDYINAQSARTTSSPRTATAPIDGRGSVIRDGVSGAEQALSEIHDAITQLEKRLETVLVPAPPTAAGNTPGKNAIASHLSGRLEILNEGYRAAVQRLRDLIARVEV